MNFEEYKQIFEEVLNISDSIIYFFKNQEFDKTTELIEKRAELFSKISSLPENLTDEQISYIQESLNTFKEKDGFIKRFTSVQNNKIKMSKINKLYDNTPSLSNTDIKNNDKDKTNVQSIFDN